MSFDFVSQFAQKLIADAGLISLPQDYLEDYQTRLEDQIVQRMGIIATENLDEQALQEYYVLVDRSQGDLSKISKEEVVRFWQEKLPNFNEVMLKGLAQFAQEFLATAKK